MYQRLDYRDLPGNSGAGLAAPFVGHCWSAEPPVCGAPQLGRLARRVGLGLCLRRRRRVKGTRHDSTKDGSGTGDTSVITALVIVQSFR